MSDRSFHNEWAKAARLSARKDLPLVQMVKLLARKAATRDYEAMKKARKNNKNKDIEP